MIVVDFLHFRCRIVATFDLPVDQGVNEIRELMRRQVVEVQLIS